MWLRTSGKLVQIKEGAASAVHQSPPQREFRVFFNLATYLGRLERVDDDRGELLRDGLLERGLDIRGELLREGVLRTDGRDEREGDVEGRL